MAIISHTLRADDFTRFCGLVHDASGMDLPEIRIADLQRVVETGKLEAGLRSNDELHRYWSDPVQGRESLKRAIAGLTVGETYFFRDSAQFDALRSTVIPELIERRSLTRTLRIWSAGCSTGEEPYSLAIALEDFSARLAGWKVTILGTDVNPTSLETARKGVYGPWSFRQAPDGVKERFFTPAGARYTINPTIRSKVTFAELNLGEEFPANLPLRDLDLILCRNVLIYLSRGAIERVARRFHQALTPSGWLVVAPSELSQASFDMFEPVNFPAAVLYRKTTTPVPKFDAQDSLSEIHWLESSPLTSTPNIASPAPPSKKLGSLADVREALAGRSEEANRLIEEAAKSGVIPVYFWAARVLADQTDWAGAQVWIERDLACEPYSARSHYLHGLILGERGQIDAAVGAVRRSIFADPNFVLGHTALADLLDRAGEPRRARAARQTAIDLLAARPEHDLIAEGDGLTVGRLQTLLRGRTTS